MSTQVKPRMLIFIDKMPTVVMWYPNTERPDCNVLFINHRTHFNSRIPAIFDYLRRYTHDDSANVTFRNALEKIYPSMTDGDLEHLYLSLRDKFRGRHCEPDERYYSPDEFLDSNDVFEVPLAMQPHVLEAILERNDDLFASLYKNIYNGDLL